MREDECYVGDINTALISPDPFQLTDTESIVESCLDAEEDGDITGTLKLNVLALDINDESDWQR